MRIEKLVAGASLVLAIACGGEPRATQKDAGVPSDAPALDASCFTNPVTNYQIINACTTAQKIYKDSHPPLLGPDGSLPPLGSAGT